MTDFEENSFQAGTSEFTTVKAGCGIRFDPDTLAEGSGFDFSEAEKIKAQCEDLEETKANASTL